MRKFPIAKPYITAKEYTAIRSVLASGALSLGPKHREFERAFAKKIGTKYACSVSSGTAGLHLAMIAAGVQREDEVITTPFSFIASANSILYVGARPVFVDINPVTYNIDPAKIEKNITKKTKAILLVHIFGQSADMDPILKLARKHNLAVVEDACESILATYKGRTVGTFGQTGVFAFYPNKQMTTGEGGMIVTDNKKIYALCSSLRNQGRAENMQWLDHQYLGYNYRLNELSAAMGIVQLEKLDAMIAARKKIAAYYNAFFKKFPELVYVPETADGNTHTWFVYVIRIKNPRIDRNRIIEELSRDSIATKPYLPSIHLFDFYRKKFKYKSGDFPIAESVSASSIALPFYIGLKEKDITYIGKKVIAALQRHIS